MNVSDQGWVISQSRVEPATGGIISDDDVSLGVVEFAGRIDVSSGTVQIDGLVLEDVGGVEGQSAAVYVRRFRATGSAVPGIAEIKIVVGEDVSPRSDPLWFVPRARDKPE